MTEATLRRLRPALETELVDDAELLRRFVGRRDEASFELLVRRHGPMVWAACRRAAGCRHAAEDAFQATFLTLATKARTLRDASRLPAWLHRVAVRAAGKVRLRPVAKTTAPVDDESPEGTAVARETVALIDAEIDRLPARLREAVVLCELRGLTRPAAAAALGCPVGTVDSRLGRAKARLRDRLRHLAPAAAVPAALARRTWAAAASRTVSVGGFSAVRAALVLGVLTAAGLAWALQPPAGNNESPPALAAEKPPGDVLRRIGDGRFRHTAPICFLDISPDGQYAAGCSLTGAVRVWNLADGHAAGEFTFIDQPWVGEILDTAFAPDGKTWLALSVSRPQPGQPKRDRLSVFAIDWRTGRRRTVWGDFGPQGAQRQGLFSGDGRRAVWLRGGRLAVIDAGSGRNLSVHNFPESEKWELHAVDHRGRTGFVGRANAADFIDLATGKRRPVRATQTAFDARFSGDRRRLFVTFRTPGMSLSPHLRCFSVETGEFLSRLFDEGDIRGRRYCSSPGGGRVAIYDFFRGRVLIDNVIGKKRTIGDPSLGLRFRPAEAIEWSRNGQKIVFALGTLVLVCDGDAKPLGEGQPPTDFRSLSPRFSRDGVELHLVTLRESIKYSVRTGRLLGRGKAPPALLGVAPAALKRIFEFEVGPPRLLSADGKRVYAWSTGTDGYPSSATDISVCDAKTGRLIRKARLEGDGVRVVGVTPDGRLAVGQTGHKHGRAAWKREFVVWDMRTGRPVRRVVGERAAFARDATLSPDGRLLAFCGRTTSVSPGRFAPNVNLEVHNLHTGAREIAVSRDKAWAVGKPAFSPDSKLLATAEHKTHNILLIEVTTGRISRRLCGHKARPEKLAFSPAGRLLASVSPEAPVYLWDVAGRGSGD